MKTKKCVLCHCTSNEHWRVGTSLVTRGLASRSTRLPIILSQCNRNAPCCATPPPASASCSSLSSAAGAPKGNGACTKASPCSACTAGGILSHERTRLDRSALPLAGSHQSDVHITLYRKTQLGRRIPKL